MPIVIEQSGGWGCQCKAFRGTVPDQFLVDVLARAADVQVSKQTHDPHSGITIWEAWSNPPDVYEVIHDPRGAGGWCKHIAACAADMVGGQLGQTYQHIKEMKAECHENAKELRKTQRMLETARRNLEKSKTTAKAAAL